MKRHTKIVCTLGPSSSSKEQILALAEAGMNVARINLSHGKREDYESLLKIVHEINDETDYTIATLFDTKGAEIRTGNVQDPIEVAKDEQITFCPEGIECTDAKVVEVLYDNFADDVRETDRILLDNGELSFGIDDIRSDGTVLATARQDGSIGSRRHINLPGADVDLPSVTEKDWGDIEYAAVENTVDYLALSFIRTAEEINEVRKLIDEKECKMQIITKIETAQAVDNISDIIAASDGIMVARGDLGSEIPFEEVPAIQDEIVTRCNDAAKPVIVATHMLESMKDHPIPTRAEITDVAHAATTYADATMLSGETAAGKHPPLVVEAMSKILLKTEEHVTRSSRYTSIPVHDDNEAKAQAAVELCEHSEANAIVVITRSGNTARLVSKFRSRHPVLACSEDPSALRQMALLYGTTSLQTSFGSPEETVANAFEAGLQAEVLTKGQQVVLITNIAAGDGEVWSIQVREV